MTHRDLSLIILLLWHTENFPSDLPMSRTEQSRKNNHTKLPFHNLKFTFEYKHVSLTKLRITFLNKNPLPSFKRPLHSSKNFKNSTNFKSTVQLTNDGSASCSHMLHYWPMAVLKPCDVIHTYIIWLRFNSLITTCLAMLKSWHHPLPIIKIRIVENYKTYYKAENYKTHYKALMCNT